MIEWWYVPGVSMSRRRSSGCDGLASSSSWNAVRIPKTLPRTANVPTATTAAPPPASAEAPHSWTTPVRSRWPRSPKVVTTIASTIATAMPAWTNAFSRSPRRIATIPAAPPKKT